MEPPDRNESKEEQELLASLPFRTRSGRHSRVAIGAACFFLGLFYLASLVLFALPALSGSKQSSTIQLAQSFFKVSYICILTGAVFSAIVACCSEERNGWLVFYPFTGPAILLALFALQVWATGG